MNRPVVFNRTLIERMPESSLAAFLAGEIDRRNWGTRAAAAHIQISKTALLNLLHNADATPELATLNKIANAFDLPLWRVIELCGFNLGLPATPSDQASRLAALVEHAPEFSPLLDQLLALRPDDLEGVLTYLEAVEVRRVRRDTQE